MRVHQRTHIDLNNHLYYNMITMNAERSSDHEDLDDRLFVDLNTPEFDEAFANAPLFTKVVQVYARKIEEGEDPEVIRTILLNGVSEAERPLEDYQPGSWIVVNPGGERYLVSPDKFAKRYEPIDAEIGLFRGIGTNRMLPNTTGRPIWINPPWDPDEVMKGDENCSFSMVVDPDDPTRLTNDRYVIGRGEKNLTYAPAGAGYKEVDLLSDEMTEYLQRNGQLHRKVGYVFLDEMEPGEAVDIVRAVPDMGALVLKLSYHPDRKLVTPRRGQRYMVDKDVASRRFEKVDETHGLYRATGAALVAPNPYPGHAIKARTPWGSVQHVPSDSSLAVAIDRADDFDRDNLPNDRYLLDKTDLTIYSDAT